VTAPPPALKEASIKPVPEPIAMSPVLPEGGGHAVFKVGKPYEVAGQTYVPKEEPSYNATGLASWYGGLHQGTMTANGERFDATKLTAAHTTLPMPSYVLVTNLANNRTVMLRVNNRGPFTKNRILDVSKSAADLLGFSKFGVARVRVTYAGRAPLDGDTSKETAFLEGQPWYKAATSTTAAATAKAPSTAPDARAAGLADTAH
jgi:rare lipoprotein A